MRKEQSATASIILIIYFLFTFPFSIAAQARNHKQGCTSSCGDVEISYPFRLEGDQAGCGDPDYELSCLNNKTLLEIFPGKCYVKNISYDVQVIRLVDVNFANGTSCSLPSGSFKSGYYDVVDFRFVPHGSPRAYTQFVKCSKKLTQANAAAYNYTAVPCLTTNNGTSFFYAIYDGIGDYVFDRLQPSCSLVSLAPSDYGADVTKPLSYEVIMKQLQAGFDLEWAVECRDCSLAGKSCEVFVSDSNSGTKPLPYQCQKDYKELTERQIILIIVGFSLGGNICTHGVTPCPEKSIIYGELTKLPFREREDGYWQALFCLVLYVTCLVCRIRKCMKRRRKKNLQRQQQLTPTVLSNSQN